MLIMYLSCVNIWDVLKTQKHSINTKLANGKRHNYSMLTANDTSPRHSIVGLPDQELLQFQWDCLVAYNIEIIK